jgi:hypothetical protein
VRDLQSRLTEREFMEWMSWFSMRNEAITNSTPGATMTNQMTPEQTHKYVDRIFGASGVAIVKAAP